MSDDELEREILSKVGFDRRAFVKRMILGSAFAVPIVASFEMDTLTSHAQAARTPNGVKRQHRDRQPSARLPYGSSTSYYTSNTRHHGGYDSHVSF